MNAKAIHDVKGAMQSIKSIYELLEVGYRFDDHEATDLLDCFGQAVRRLSSYVDQHLTLIATTDDIEGL